MAKKNSFIKIVATIVFIGCFIIVFRAFAAPPGTTLCGVTDLEEPIWGEVELTCPCPAETSTISCEKNEGTMTNCSEYCCSSCYFPGIQPE